MHLDRRGIVNENFRWSFTQTFDAYKVGGLRAVTNTHPMSDILPVPVRLTKKSSHDPAKGLGQAGQIFRLLKDCVVMLRLFCTSYKPELIRDTRSDKSDKSDESGGSDEDEDEDEDDVEEEGADKNEVEDEEEVHHPVPAKELVHLHDTRKRFRLL